MSQDDWRPPPHFNAAVGGYLAYGIYPNLTYDRIKDHTIPVTRLGPTGRPLIATSYVLEARQGLPLTYLDVENAQRIVGEWIKHNRGYGTKKKLGVVRLGIPAWIDIEICPLLFEEKGWTLDQWKSMAAAGKVGRLLKAPDNSYQRLDASLLFSNFGQKTVEDYNLSVKKFNEGEAAQPDLAALGDV